MGGMGLIECKSTQDAHSKPSALSSAMHQDRACLYGAHRSEGHAKAI